MSLFTAELYSIVQTAYGSFTHFPADGHVGHFQFGALLNKAALSTLVRLLHGHAVRALEYLPRRAMTDQRTEVHFNFLKPPKSFSKWLHYVTLPPLMYESSWCPVSWCRQP